MKILTAKTLGIGGGLATVTGGGITVACLSYGSSKTNSDPSIKQPDSITQLPAESDVIKKDLPPKAEPKAITSFLKEANFEIPEKGTDKSKWKNIWTSFKTKYKTDPLPEAWTIEGWSDLKEQDEAPDKYIDKCIEKGQQKINDSKEDIFAQVKEYCAVAKDS